MIIVMDQTEDIAGRILSCGYPSGDLVHMYAGGAGGAGILLDSKRLSKGRRVSC